MKIIKINLKLKFLKLLTSIMGLVILILFNVKDGYCYEYYLLLSPSDCTKCSPIFKSLEDDFFKANNIKYHVITPFRNEWEGTKLVEEYFMLDKSNIIEIENNVSKFKKFSKSNFSRLVVLKKGKVLLSSEVIGLNFYDIPIAYSLKLKKTFKVDKNSGIPFYANEFRESISGNILRNIIYNDVFFISDSNTVSPIKLNDTLYNYILKVFGGFSKDSITSFKEYITQHRSKPISILNLCTTHDTCYHLLISVNIPSDDRNNISFRHFLMVYNFNGNLKSIHAIESANYYENKRMDRSYIYPFVCIDKTHYIFSLFSPKSELENDSLFNDYYTSSIYSIKEDSLVFQKFAAPRLDTFYLAHKHFYINTWFNFVTINDTLYQYYQYLNTLTNIYSGKKIFLCELNASSLKLPDYAGGSSNKPFELICISQISKNIIGYVVYNKKGTRFVIYDYVNDKIIFQEKLKGFIKPAAIISGNKLKVAQGNISGSFTIKTYEFNHN